MSDTISELMFALGRMDAHLETLGRLLTDVAMTGGVDELYAENGAEVKDERIEIDPDNLPF